MSLSRAAVFSGKVASALVAVVIAVSVPFFAATSASADSTPPPPPPASTNGHEWIG